MKHLLLPLFSLFLSCLHSIVNGAESPPLCSFPNHKSTQPEMHKRLQSLLGRRFITDDKNLVLEKDHYTYHIGICINADERKTFGENVGVLQTKAIESPDKEKKVQEIIVGRFNNSQLIEGTDWLILEYGSGDKYHKHCDGESRKSRIMITCDKTVKEGEEKVVVFDEQNDKINDCYYLFEMASSTVCEKEPIVTVSLSVGSILVIVFIVVVFLYILLGFLYNRLVLGAKGKEQIPNYSFWQDFGNLQADGCNFVCRSGSKMESKQYKGVGDDQLLDDDDRDDHLLPM